MDVALRVYTDHGDLVKCQRQQLISQQVLIGVKLLCQMPQTYCGEGITQSFAVDALE